MKKHPTNWLMPSAAIAQLSLVVAGLSFMLFSFSDTLSFADNTDEVINSDQSGLHPSHGFFDTDLHSDAPSEKEALTSYLHNRLSATGFSPGELRLYKVRNSPAGHHLEYRQYFEGTPVYGGLLMVWTDKSGKLRLTSGQLADTRNWHVGEDAKLGMPQNFIAGIPPLAQWNTERFLMQKDSAQASVLWQYQVHHPHNQSSYEYLVSAGGVVLSKRDFRRYQTGTDTVATLNVFKPDPLTSSESVYGDEISDDGDENSPELQAELFSATTKARFDGVNFVLENDFFAVRDLSPPNIIPPAEPLPFFLYDRSENGFEDANAFYHLNAFRQWLDSLGFDSLATDLLEIDAHAVNGADNSFFLPGSPSSLQFGEGGVDDAEDADVIIHEYGHALSYAASGLTNVGFERNGLDEGFGDYLAVSWSRSFSDYRWYEVFSWDGHNPFWDGRLANTDRHYPEDLGSTIYDAGELWSSALMDIYNELGRNVTDKLAITCMYGAMPNMQLTEAAQLILLADSMLYEGDHYSILYDLLSARGLLPMVSAIAEVQLPPSGLSAIWFGGTNSFGVAPHQLSVHSSQEDGTASVSLFNMGGQLLQTDEIRFFDGVFLWQTAMLNAGVYILNVHINGHTASAKLLVR